MKAQVVKWGNSQGLRLPKVILDAVGISTSDIVEIVVEQDEIVIRKAVESDINKTTAERFQGYNDDSQPAEFDWGAPQGKEIW